MTNRHKLLMSIALIGIANSSQIVAQSQTAGVSFEVASIKLTQTTGAHVHINRDPGMLQMENVTLQDRIREAYGVTDYQISGEKWLGPDRYDIVAKMPSGITADQRERKKCRYICWWLRRTGQRFRQ